MNGSLRNKIKRVACIACTALSLGGFNVSKSNAMSKGAKAGTITASSAAGLAVIFGAVLFVKKIVLPKISSGKDNVNYEKQEIDLDGGLTGNYS